MLRSIVLSSALRQRLKAVAFIVAPVVLSSAGIGSVKPRSGTYDVLSGRVLDAEERTIAGATVFVTADPKLQKTTDDKGRFHFSEAETKRLLDKAAVDKPLAGLDLVAVADGFGLDWINVQTYATTSTKDDLDPTAATNITLRLVEDAPIRGRLVNSEGDPIPNVRIAVGEVMVLDLSRWLKEWETSTRKSCWRLVTSYAQKRYTPVRRRFLRRNVPVLSEPVLTTVVKTDEEGRFAVRGVGRERAVYLSAEHPDFVSKTIFVAIRDDFILAPANAALPPLHPATFVQDLEPAKPIGGVVREHGTGKPLGGATLYMSMHPSKEPGSAKATTAEDGTFRIRGLGEAERYLCVVVSAEDQPHLRRTLRLTATHGLNPLNVDVELFRGVVIKGNVKNKATGEPVFRAKLTYIPLTGNPHLDGLREAGPAYWDRRFETDLDGTFDVAIPPGPGLIGVRASFDGGGDQFRDCNKDDFPCPLEEEEGEYYFKSATGRIIRPQQFHAVVIVNPTKDVGTRPLNIKLNPK